MSDDFDLASAQPVTGEFDLASAQPVGAAAATPEQKQDPGLLSKLRSLDQKYLGGYGRQAVLAARAVPDAAQHLINIVPDAAMAAVNYALPDKYKQQLPSQAVAGYMDKILPHPENTTEAVTHGVEEFLSGARMPIPGGYGEMSPTGQPSISFNPAQGPGGMSRGDTQKALEKLQARLQKDNRPWPGAAQDVKQANEQGIPLRLTDIGPNTRATGEVLAQKPGGASTTMLADRSAIAADTTPRVAEQTRDALNAHGDVGRYGDILQQTRSSNAKANYEAVRNDPQPVMDPDIWHLLEDPNIARVYQEAKAMNQNVRSLDARMGKSTPPLADIYAPAPAVMPRPGAQGDHLLPPPDGQPQWVRTGTAPDVRSIDFLQRALNTKIGQLFNQAQSGQGARGGEGDLASSLKSARQALVDRLKDISPSFKKASETYGEDSEILQAHEAGRGSGEGNFFSMSPKQAQLYVNGLSESAKSALRMGVAEKLLGQAEMSGRNFDLAKSVAGGERKQDLLWTLFDGDKQKFDTFMKGLQLESKLFRNNSAIMGGSQTFRRLEAADDFQSKLPEGMGQAADTVAQGATGRWGTMMHGLFRLMQKGVWNQSVASQAARILSSPDPEQAVTALQSMENQLAQAPLKTRAAVAATKGAAAASPGPDRQQLAEKYGVE